MSEPQKTTDMPRPGDLFEHAFLTTGYNGPDGPEPVIFEVTEVTDTGKVFYGPAQRGIETTPTLWMWANQFERDVLGAWVGSRVRPTEKVSDHA